MTLARRKLKRRPPRQLDARQAQQILSDGGMLLHARGVWSAYRSLDARRMRIGVVPEALALSLEDTGFARRHDSQRACLVSAHPPTA